MSPSPSPSDLERLAQKYKTLGELRRARARGEPIPERAVFQELAAAFPGALTELDTLPLDEIDRRADLLERASADGATTEPWMEWLHAYHALLRAALFIRKRTLRARVVDGQKQDKIDPALATKLAEEASARAGARVDEAFVQAITRPQGGRILTVVYERLSAIYGAPPAAIKGALFPKRRGQVA
jgi:hypothetical protein